MSAIRDGYHVELGCVVAAMICVASQSDGCAVCQALVDYRRRVSPKLFEKAQSRFDGWMSAGRAR